MSGNIEYSFALVAKMSSMPPHFNFNANIPTAAIGLLRIQIKFNDGLVRLGRSGRMRTKVLHRGRNRVGKGDHDEARLWARMGNFMVRESGSVCEWV